MAPLASARMPKGKTANSLGKFLAKQEKPTLSSKVPMSARAAAPNLNRPRISAAFPDAAAKNASADIKKVQALKKAEVPFSPARETSEPDAETDPKLSQSRRPIAAATPVGCVLPRSRTAAALIQHHEDSRESGRSRLPNSHAPPGRVHATSGHLLDSAELGHNGEQFTSTSSNLSSSRSRPSHARAISAITCDVVQIGKSGEQSFLGSSASTVEATVTEGLSEPALKPRHLWKPSATPRNGFAHDAPVVPVLTVDRPVNAGGRRERSQHAAERHEYDNELIMSLDARAGAANVTGFASRRSATPAHPMRSAFTDRSLRLREGAQSRAVFEAGAGLADLFNGSHTNCNCPTCHPFDLPAAGQMSQFTEINKADSSKRIDNAARNSSSMGKLMEPDNAGMIRHPDVADQLQFKKELGNKMRVVRAVSCEPETSSGQHRPQRKFRPQTPSRSRDPVAMILSPQADDPLPSMQITPSKKGVVDVDSVISKEAEKQSVRWGQPLYRFELKAVEESQRSRSVPPKRAYNPLTWEGNEHALTKLAARSQRPLPCNRENESSGAMRAMNFALVAKEQAVERRARLREEPQFEALCQMAESHAKEASQKSSAVAGRTYRSRGVAASLQWNQ